ncbi:MAG: DnaB-like helicase C-terminal domain-containing protein [Bacteroidales bacterium]|nr:DnaB-like helicase C-terminal domain-containing protein [Bacteroidales bacterium]
MKLNHLMALTPDKECEPLATGFQCLDHLIGGLRIGQICTIAARPGMGKTAFAVSLLRNIGVIQKVPTAFFSFGLSESEIMRRLKASITGSWEPVPYREITPPVEVINEMDKIGFHLEKGRNIEQEAMQMMEEAPVWIEQDLGVDIDEFVSRVEQLHQDNHVRVVIIDSMHEIRCANNHTEQSQALRKLYQAADSLKLAVILTSWLNRSVETRDGSKRPWLIDLRDWYQLEYFSSMVMFVYRPEYYYLDTLEDNTSSEDMADIMVEKNSFGDTGNVRMHFDNHAGFREIPYVDNDKSTHL